jgi:steroid delta-isomerase-like uncharacterized protein
VIRVDNTERSRRAHEAFNTRDWYDVVRECAPDLVYVDRARDLTLKGPDEFVEYLRDGWVAAFPNGAITRAVYLASPDAVVCRFVGVGTQDGPLDGRPGSGRSMRLPCCEVHTFNPAGQIVTGELYYDRLTMLTQLGLPSA